MKRRLLLLLIPFLALSCVREDEETLFLKGILDDPLMAQVDSMARAVAATGFNAGDGYKEVWIRVRHSLSLSLSATIPVCFLERDT